MGTGEMQRHGTLGEGLPQYELYRDESIYVWWNGKRWRRYVKGGHLQIMKTDQISHTSYIYCLATQIVNIGSARRF